MIGMFYIPVNIFLRARVASVVPSGFKKRNNWPKYMRVCPSCLRVNLRNNDRQQKHFPDSNGWETCKFG